jgi:polyhydroxyalkanoate synthesis regulator phasin
METQAKKEPMTREKARAILNRLLKESREYREEREKTMLTDPAIQEALARLERRKAAHGTLIKQD